MELAINIVGVVTSVFGIAGGLYAFYGWMSNTVFAPRPLVSLAEPLEGEAMRDNPVPKKYVIYRMQIENRSKRTLGDARVYILRAYRLDPEGKLVRWQDMRSKVPLPWTNTGGKVTAELFPSETGRLDFLFRWADARFVGFMSSQGPSESPVVLQPGSYVLEVVCTARHAKQAHLCLHVAFSEGSPVPVIREWKEGKA